MTLSQKEKREIVDALLEHLGKEELHTSEAAKLLNLNPIYVSMAKNERSWDSMTRVAWDRLFEWVSTRGDLKAFKIPEGEEIFKRKEKVRNIESVGPEEHSPESVFTEPAPILPAKSRKPKKEKSGKIVKVILNQAELADLRQKIKFLEGEIKNAMTLFNLFESELRDIKEKPVPEPVKADLKVAESKPGIIIFQRNIYKA
jgi:hypothetical protein